MESLFITELGEFGIENISDTMERFVDDEEFYRETLEMLVEDDGYFALEEKIRENRIDEAFDIAHTLKGIITNCGITPQEHIIVEIVETLRAGRTDGLDSLCEALEESRRALAQIVAQAGENE